MSSFIGCIGRPVIDNFTLKAPHFQLAVEVAAGNALFNVIVNTDETAARLMKELERRNAGRLTFLPLNRLRVESIKYPDSRDVRPLLETTIEYKPEVAVAMQHTFGKKLLARDLAIAAHYR